MMMAYYFENYGIDALHNYISEFNPSKIIVITDNNTQSFCLDYFKNLTNLEFTNVNIKNGDIHKNINTLSDVWKQLMKAGVDRKTLMINLGGGVVTDLGGFAAATFKRGLKFIHVPTTLLGMVDAAIGGKNGINFMEAKNQIGTIVQPEFVWIFTGFLKTLPEEEFISGFAEMLKHGLIADRAYWKDLISYAQNPNHNHLLPGLIKKSVTIKDHIIQEDPFEQGKRKLLNFGHTIGHALESFMNYQKNIPLSHGKAIAAGMIMEAYLSFKLNGLNQSDLAEIKQSINSLYPIINLSINEIKEIINLMRFDKKNENGVVKFVLVNRIGSADFNKEAPEQLLYEAFDFYQS